MGYYERVSLKTRTFRDTLNLFKFYQKEELKWELFIIKNQKLSN